MNDINKKYYQMGFYSGKEYQKTQFNILSFFLGIAVSATISWFILHLYFVL
jgi:hypothetical protein